MPVLQGRSRLEPIRYQESVDLFRLIYSPEPEPTRDKLNIDFNDSSHLFSCQSGSYIQVLRSRSRSQPETSQAYVSLPRLIYFPVRAGAIFKCWGAGAKPENNVAQTFVSSHKFSCQSGSYSSIQMLLGRSRSWSRSDTRKAQNCLSRAKGYTALSHVKKTGILSLKRAYILQIKNHCRSSDCVPLSAIPILTRNCNLLISKTTCPFYMVSYYIKCVKSPGHTVVKQSISK